MRAAAAAWTLTVLALGAATSSAMAAQRSDSVLVQVDASATAGARAQVSRVLDAEAVRTLVAGWRAYDLAHPVTLTEARSLLADAPAADAVQLDQRLYPLDVPDDTYYSQQWALPKIGAPDGWVVAGAGPPVIVAVIDTGVDISHPDLAGRLWTNTAETPGNGIDDDVDGLVDDVDGWNFADGNAQVYNAADVDSHGTHVAGTIAARRDNAVGVAGVADNARIMPLKFLKPGGGYTSDAMAAVDYAVDKGASVINGSWGGSAYSQPLCDAIQLAGNAGVLFVAAAGNASADNDVTPTWPANCPASSLISVAATTSSDGLASFSNRGATQVDLGAPGESIFSTVPGGYAYKSGTSMAAPHVTAVAAVLLGEHPGLVPWQLKAALTSGGDPVAALSGTTVSGRRLSLLGALGVTAGGVGADATPPDPFATLSPADAFATTLVAPTFRWEPATDAQSGVAGYRLVVDGATAADVPAGTTSAVPGASLAEGSHTWTVTARDAIGNVRAAAARTLVIDRTAPTPPGLSAPADRAAVAGPAVSLSWGASIDAGTGVAGYRVIVDGVGVVNTAAAERHALVTLPLGAHTWQVVARDAVGNTSAAQARVVTVTGRSSSTARRAITLGPPPRVVPGRRPVLRVRLARPARVTFALSRASRARGVGTFARTLRAGSSTVTVPSPIARKLRAGGVYLVTARGPGMVDSVRFRVARRA